MISICIPIYNFNVTALVSALAKQSEQLPEASEIILIDDCSLDSIKLENQAICASQQYIQLDQNIGRSAIRNRFLNYAKYEHLLFLDCDSLIISNDFLSNYVQALRAHPNGVICGGRVYNNEKPERDKLLRWKYGIEKESQPISVRSKFPNRSFMTNNFAVNRILFESIKFDERLIEYGHEDTLFGFELKRRDIEIVHIDNSILNGDLENNTDYMLNTEKAISNLNHLLAYTHYDQELINDITLLNTYKKLYKFRFILRIAHFFKGPIIRFLLSKGIVSLFLFNIYKLGYTAQNVKLKN